MAVSFKVPSSPRKDVFQIENFMGVDFTNTGSSIDEVRSPNAENMVRYVPGKVRKRTGYKTQMLINTGTNVNRALGTSDNEQIYELTYSSPAVWTHLYEVIDWIQQNKTYYYEFDYCVEGKCTLWISRGLTLSDTNGEWIHASGTSFNDQAGYRYVQTTPLGGDCVLKLKNFSLMEKKDDDYTWEATPEERNVIYFKSESDEPVYGSYELKTNNIAGNYVKGINRMPNTSSEWTTITPCELAPYEVLPEGQTISYAFDYRNLDLGSYTYASINVGNSASAFSSESGSISATYTISGNNVGTIFFRDFESMEIRNFRMCYQEGSTIPEWSLAPEDLGMPFDLNYVYEIDNSKNYSPSSHIVDNIIITASQTNKTATLQIPTVALDSELIYLEFEIEIQPSITSPSIVATGYDNIYLNYNTNGSVRISGYGQGYETLKYYAVVDSSNGTQYISSISVGLNAAFSTHPGECAITVDNLKIYKARKRATYNIFANYYLYHVGRNMYVRGDDSPVLTRIYRDMNADYSKAWQIGDYLYIVDGLKYRKFDSTSLSIESVENTGTIPLVTIAKQPNGGGISYNPFNLINTAFEEDFSGTESDTVYYMSLPELDELRPPKVEVLNNQGERVALEYGSDYTYNAYEGCVVFASAPGVSPVTGEDNIFITAYKTITDYADRINKCTIGTLFGVNGESDRLFLSGNSEHRNWDFYSEKNDPTYFPDTGYSSLGLETSAIVGYAKVNNYLATCKDDMELEQNILIREGDLIKRKEMVYDEEMEFSDPAFKLINTLQGASAYGKNTFCNMQNEPIFLTKSGLFAITAQDITGEKYGQNRSFYLNGKLLKEENLDKAYATIYNDMYILAVNDKLYILDGLQPVQTDRSMPYATRQYVGFYCTNVPANIIYKQDDALWIGTHDGKICKFATNVEDLSSYNDDGEPIYCCWETPDLDGKLFYKNKTFRYFAIRMMKALRTSVECYYNRNGNWSPAPFKIDASSGIVFDFNNIDFSAFSFSTNNSEKVVHSKVKVKKVDKAKFKIENKEKNEPLGLLNLALEYVESGNYKG